VPTHDTIAVVNTEADWNFGLSLWPRKAWPPAPMKKPSKAYWSLFDAVKERLLEDVLRSIRPGLLGEMLGLAPRVHLPHSEPSANERYWVNWLREFSEIHSSVERLDQVLAYLSHYPGNKTFRGLSESDWLRYHIEVYLHETYILRERLKRFLKRVERSKLIARDSGALGVVRMLQTHVDTALVNVIRLRGSHVHDQRFDDEELKKLDVLVLITQSGKLRALGRLRKLPHTTTLAKWRKQLRRNNKQTMDLCEDIFKYTAPILARNEPPKPR
jgi:hypothetical protein